MRSLVTGSLEEWWFSTESGLSPSQFLKHEPFFMKNWFLIKFVRWWRPRPHPISGRILVVTTTALGDTLWATPALKALRKSCSYLGVLTSPIGAEVLKNNPSVDQIYVLKNLFSLRKALYREKFDTVLIFHTSQRIALPLVCLIGASRVIGTCGINKGLDELLTIPLKATYEHEITRRLKIAAVAGATIPQDQTLSFFLKEHLPPRQGKWIAIHPGSQDRFKRWPVENFVTLGRKLKEVGYEVLITGNQKERDLMRQIATQIPGAHLDIENRSLHSFAAVLEQMDLVISNDTGPAHLACALKRPAISLFIPTDPQLCGPHQAAQAIAISRPPTCSPCMKRACRSPFCFLQIGVGEVISHALAILK